MKLQSSLNSIIMIELSPKVSTCTMITLGREVDVEHAIYGKACKSIRAGFLSFNIFCSCARSKYISQSPGARGCPQRRIWCVLVVVVIDLVKENFLIGVWNTQVSMDCAQINLERTHVLSVDKHVEISKQLSTFDNFIFWEIENGPNIRKHDTLAEYATICRRYMTYIFFFNLYVSTTR